MKKKVLLLGCGHSRGRNIRLKDEPEDFTNDDLVTLDIDPNCGADIVHDIRGIPKGEKLPFEDGIFDEIHAYDVLEHIGTQGDWEGFFIEFAEYHRLLKNGGKMYILVPIGPDALADPGHSRFFHMAQFAFLNQAFNNQEKKTKGTTSTDYSWYWKKNFDVILSQEFEGHHLAVVIVKNDNE